jgi:glycosyltransferase involved in cell wall biosynthesis
MTLYFFTEARLILANDGNFYNPGGAQKYELFKRYLRYFSNIIIVCRVKDDFDYVVKSEEIVNGENITIHRLPYYLGPVEYVLKKISLSNEISKIIKKGNAYILRLPGNIGNLAGHFLTQRNIPYGVEIVGDPSEVFSKNGIKHPLKSLFRIKLVSNLKKYVLESSANLYVTSKTLQSKYPSKPGIFNVGVSDVKILPNELVSQTKEFNYNDGLKIISIGSLDQMYKGPDVLIKAVSELNKRGVNVLLNWVGKGKYLSDMIKLAEELGIQEKVNFLGHISEKTTINSHLDSNNLFVLASRTEGLPRVIIEAFSRGLPVFATNVGGIPELLEKDQMFDNENVEQLVELVENLIKDPILYNKLSERNLAKAYLFQDFILEEKREQFFNEIIRVINK